MCILPMAGSYRREWKKKLFRSYFAKINSRIKPVDCINVGAIVLGDFHSLYIFQLLPLPHLLIVMPHSNGL